MRYSRKISFCLAIGLFMVMVGLAWANKTGTLIGVGAGTFIYDTSGGVHWGGVIVLDVSGQPIGTYCIDLHHPIGLGDEVVATDVLADCRIKWLVHHYPPLLTGLSDTEGAARQAAVWHFSDNFIPVDTDAVGERAWEIIDELNLLTNYGANIEAACDDLWPGPVSLTITPAQGDSLLTGETAQFTVTASQNGQALTNLAVKLSTNFGTLNRTTITTNSQGKATFSVTATAGGKASITAQASYELPAGTVFHGVIPTRQKLVLGQYTTGNVIAKATTTWVNNGMLETHIFRDSDGNGQQNGAETNLAGWMVILKNNNGITIQQQQTDSNGNVTFTALAPAEYTVSYELPQGWQGTTPMSTTVNINNDTRTAEFGALQSPIVVAHVFHDVNHNGLPDEGEAWLSGWTVSLAAETITQTDEQGQAVLTVGEGFKPNSYHITETVMGGWFATTPTEQVVSLTDGSYTELYFGNDEIPPLGSLTIIKEANVVGSFGFKGTLGQFTLQTGEAMTFEGLSAGDYTIAEDPTTFSGGYWALLSVRCVDQNNQAITASWVDFTASINLEAGQALTCIFLNEQATVEPHHNHTTYIPLIRR